MYEIVGQLTRVNWRDMTGTIIWKGGSSEVRFDCSEDQIKDAFKKYKLSLFEYEYDDEDIPVIKNIEGIVI